MDLVLIILGLVLRSQGRKRNNRTLQHTGTIMALIGVTFVFVTGIPVAIRNWRQIDQPLPGIGYQPSYTTTQVGNSWKMGPIQLTIPEGWVAKEVSPPKLSGTAEVEFTDTLSGSILTVVVGRQADPNKSPLSEGFAKKVERDQRSKLRASGGEYELYESKVTTLGPFPARRVDEVIVPANPGLPGQASPTHYVSYWVLVGGDFVATVYYLPEAKFSYLGSRFEDVLATIRLDTAFDPGTDVVNEVELLSQQVVALFAEKRFAEAEPLQKQVVSQYETNWPDHVGLVTPLDYLGYIYRNLGRHSEAVPLYERILELREQEFGPQSVATADALASLAAVYEEWDKQEKAEPFIGRAMAIYAQGLTSDHPELVVNLVYLSAEYMNEGRWKRAEVLIRRCLAVYEQLGGAYQLDVVRLLHNLVLVLDKQGYKEEIKDTCERSLSLLDQKVGLDHPEAIVLLTACTELQ